MGANFYATPFFGIPIPKSNLEVKTPNPLWGKSKFDPDTGEKVEQFLVERLYADDLACQFELEYTEATDCKYTFFGKPLSESVSFDRDEYKPFTELAPEEVTQINERVRQLCAYLKIDAKPPRCYTVVLVSY